MHWHRLISPDYFLGKLLGWLRALFDVGVLIVRHPTRQSWRMATLVLRVKPQFTMVTSKNLFALYDLVQVIERKKLAGAIVECGVWNGGSAALMAMASADLQYPIGRRGMWLFDSFEGLPPPSAGDGSAEQTAYFQGWCKGDVERVKQIFHRLRLPIESLTIVKGWFSETLSTVSVGPIALLHIDADWYASVKLALDVFYDRVVPGGYVMLDDYGYWQGCNQAVTDFFGQRSLPLPQLTQTAHGGAFFQKAL